MSAEAGRVSAELADLVFEIAGRLRAGFNTAATEMGLPHAQALVLTKLAEPTPMRAIAEWLHCEPSNVTGIVDGLERRGLVVRRPDPVDRRVKHVLLTEEGERRQAALHSRCDDQVRALFDLADADRLRLRDLLARTASGPGGCEQGHCGTVPNAWAAGHEP